MSWQRPSITIKWGDYFPPDPAEQKQLVDLVNTAIGGAVPLLTLRQAVEKIAPIFGIENIEAAVKLVEEDAKKRADEAHAREMEKTEAKSKPKPGAPV